MPELRTDVTPAGVDQTTAPIASPAPDADVAALFADHDLVDLDIEATAAVSAGAEPPTAVHDPHVAETTEDDAALAAAADTIEPPVAVHLPGDEHPEPDPEDTAGATAVEGTTPAAGSQPQAPRVEAVPDSTTFRRKLRGYDRQQVDLAVAQLEHRVAAMDAELGLRAARIEELDESVRRARMELRYWHDRQAFIDAEIDRARQTANDIETATRERCERLEQDAQQRAITMIDRVCTEANGILAHAREEAQALVSRYDDDVELSEQRIRQLGSIQQDIVHAMRGALSRFEDGIQELDLVTPSAQAVRHPAPSRQRGTGGQRTQPTFGRERAAAASARMDPQPSGQGVLDTRDQVQLGAGEDAPTTAAPQVNGPF